MLDLGGETGRAAGCVGTDPLRLTVSFEGGIGGFEADEILIEGKVTRQGTGHQEVAAVVGSPSPGPAFGARRQAIDLDKHREWQPKRRATRKDVCPDPLHLFAIHPHACRLWRLRGTSSSRVRHLRLWPGNDRRTRPEAVRGAATYRAVSVLAAAQA